jgi:hypothetical protein
MDGVLSTEEDEEEVERVLEEAMRRMDASDEGVEVGPAASNTSKNAGKKVRNRRAVLRAGLTYLGRRTGAS